MFLIVTSTKNEYSKLKGLRKYHLDKFEQNGAQFGILTLKSSAVLKNKRVRSIIAMFGQRVMFDENMREYATKIQTTDYSLALTKNGLEYILKGIASTTPSFSATLIDISCRHIDFAQTISGYCSLLKVITNKEEKYSAFAQNMYEQNGNAVIVTNSLEQLNDSIIIVSPDNVILKEMEGIFVPIITTNKPAYNLPLVISEFNVSTPKKFQLNTIPLNQHEYQSYLYKYCDLQQLGNLTPTQAMIGTKKCELANLKII
ncbi:MAG: hypothetical protein RR497_02990 [Oscillospiraceae bacterium]